ncbi:MAG: ATP-binding protein [Alphaproteobacteria bacterium]|jgi:two-component system nitrogen regulation sensor histidine kinase GlnL
MSSINADTIWQSLPMPALLIAPNDSIINVNLAAENFLNTSARMVVGEPVTQRIATDDTLRQALARCRSNASGVYLNDVTFALGDRQTTSCTIQIAPLQDDPQTLLMLISPRVIADRIGRARGASSAAKSAIGMAEMLAHEIKNPLAGISGAAQLLSMNLSTEDRELTDLIVEETRRIVKLLEQVEQFGNIRPADRRAINIHDALDRARRSAQMGYAAQMLFIEDYDPSLPTTFADPDQLMQVFLNLIKNATEAAKDRPNPGRGTIRLHTFYDHSLRLRGKDGSNATLPLQVEIIDDGPGIPADIAQDIFEPFVSGRENGTGLGLALVSKIISDHGGWISVDSVPGKTVFRLSLPMSPKEPKEKV